MLSMKAAVKILVPIIMILALVIGCAPQSQLAANPSPAATTTVKKPAEVFIYAIADLSGPAAAAMKTTVMAYEDFWPAFNSTQGGIDGVKANWVWLDSQGDKVKSLAAYTQIRESTPRPVMCCMVQGSDVEAMSKRAAEDKISVFTITPPTTTIWPPARVFGSSPSYEDLSGAFIDWLSGTWAKGGETSKCRLAFFNPDIAAGHSVAGSSVLEFTKTKSNIEIVSNDFFDYRALDLSSDILKIMQNKPDYIYGFFYATSGAAFFRSIDSSGFRGKVKLATCVSGMQPEITLQIDKQLVEGLVGPHYYPAVLPLDAKQENPGVERAAKMFKEKGYSPTLWGTAYPGSQGVALWMVGMLNNAVKENGWDKFNGDSFYKSCLNVRNLNCGDMFNWGLASTGKRTNSQMRIFQFKDGLVRPITDFVTAPDLRPAEFRTAEYGWTAAGWPAGTK